MKAMEMLPAASGGMRVQDASVVSGPFGAGLKFAPLTPKTHDKEEVQGVVYDTTKERQLGVAARRFH